MVGTENYLRLFLIEMILNEAIEMIDYKVKITDKTREQRIL